MVLMWVSGWAYPSKPWQGQNLSSDFQWKFRELIQTLVAPSQSYVRNLRSHPRIAHTEFTSSGSIGGISCCLAVRWCKVSHQAIVSVVIFGRNVPEWQHAGRGSNGRNKRNYDEHDGEGKKERMNEWKKKERKKEWKMKLKMNKLPRSLIAHIHFRNRALRPARWLRSAIVVALLLQKVSMNDGRAQKRKEQLEEKQWWRKQQMEYGSQRLSFSGHNLWRPIITGG